MLLAWLLPDSSETLLRDGWKRPVYRPRHCKPPLAVRACQTLSAALAVARDRYLDAAEEDAMTRAPRPAS
jgi:hypothetical protein